MRAKRSINYEIVKRLFDEGADGEDHSSYFRIHGGPEPITVYLPASIVYRPFRLGQAYNIRQLKYLEPEIKLVIGSVDTPAFFKDLERLKKLVNDEVIHHYVDALLAAINLAPGPSAKHIAVSTGEF